MLTRSNIICCILSVLLIGYLVVAIMMTSSMQANARAPYEAPVKIVVSDADSSTFVTRREVATLVAPYLGDVHSVIPAALKIYDIETMLNGIDNIESAQCTRRSNDRIWIEVVPMRPVARIFDDKGSYYINRDGKRLTASLQYRCNVPVITGQLKAPHTAQRLMPLLDYIRDHKGLSQLVTDINLESNGDVTLVPPFRGHVIEFGAPDVNIENKFDRLITMYRDIIPVKGWDFYDKLSVKFAGQVVCTRRKARQRDPLLILDPEGDSSDNEDISTMTVNDAPSLSI